MNPCVVRLMVRSRMSWVEIWRGEEQVGEDIDCRTIREGRAAAKRECKRLGLRFYEEHHIVKL